MVEIVPYDPNWPIEFTQLANAIRSTLGETALRIDHIGSTSVPDLDAKNVIDIQVTVPSLIDDLIVRFLSIGYVHSKHRTDHLPPGAPQDSGEWEKLLFERPAGERRVHVHVRVLGKANQRYPLLFRDYLRSHPTVASAYAELKRRLAQYLADPEAYPDVKDPAVDLIYLAAKEWAAASNWSPGPPDA